MGSAFKIDPQSASPMASNHHHFSTGLSHQHPPCLLLLAQFLHTAAEAPPPRKPAPICPCSSQSTQRSSNSQVLAVICPPHLISLPLLDQPNSLFAVTLASACPLTLESLPGYSYPPIRYYHPGHGAKSLPSLKPIHMTISKGNLPHPPGEYCHSHLLSPQCSCLLTYSVFQCLVLMIPCQARVSAFQGQRSLFQTLLHPQHENSEHTRCA